ncbi:tubulin epsilon chain isoform X1 [Meleagris gallopavo]|nr:tubulin epsilon chain isoform X1 [Meleagris gallopavo]
MGEETFHVFLFHPPDGLLRIFLIEIVFCNCILWGKHEACCGRVHFKVFITLNNKKSKRELYSNICCLIFYYSSKLGMLLFFRSAGDGPDIYKGKICSLKARALLIDMEEGVVNEILQGPLRDVFDSKQLITDVSGSGNNWAVGYKVYGCQYRENIVEKLRKTAEHCDCLQCFFIIHSMGGGTGSGLGTFVLNLLEDEFPEVYRFVTSVYPSGEDDVITSPYNSVLAMKELNEHADCVLPIENESLFDIVNKIHHMVNSGKLGSTVKPNSLVTSSAGTTKKVQEKPFDAMNNIVANLLLNLTSSARFEGSLNMDLNEISMNLVPFPRLHYLVSSLTPLYTLADVNIPSRR